MGDRDKQTEQRILEAAQRVFVRRGTAGARMQEIAAEAGVNKALLHYYFRSKERLAEAVFQPAAARLFRAVFETMQSDASIEEKVTRVVEIELDVLSKNPFLPGYILSEINHHPDRAMQLAESLRGFGPHRFVPKLLERLAVQIEERVRAGTMHPISPEQFMANLIALCVFPFAARPLLATALGWDETGFARFVEERKRTLPEFFLNALRP
jgi:TetR/AcrR family transcriptional regulator